MIICGQNPPFKGGKSPSLFSSFLEPALLGPALMGPVLNLGRAVRPNKVSFSDFMYLYD